MAGFLNFAVPAAEIGGGGIGEFTAARERAQKRQQESEGYRTAIESLAAQNPQLKFLSQAVQAGAPPNVMFQTGMNMYPGLMKQQEVTQKASSQRTALVGFVNAQVAAGNKDPIMGEIAKLASDPNADPAVIEKLWGYIQPKSQDPVAEAIKQQTLAQKQMGPQDAFTKWMRDNAYPDPSTLPDDARRAFYQKFNAEMTNLAGGKSEATAAGRTKGALTATREIAAPDVLMTAKNLENSGQKVFPEHAGYGVAANAADVWLKRKKGDPDVMAFDAARATLIDYAKLLASGQRLTRTEFEQINGILESDNLSMDSIRTVTKMMREAANRKTPGVGATAGAPPTESTAPKGLTPSKKHPGFFYDAAGKWYDASGKPL